MDRSRSSAPEPVVINAQSYIHKTQEVNKITQSYERLMEENKTLRERLAELKAQYNKELGYIRH